MKTRWGWASAAGRVTCTVSSPFTRAGISRPISRQSRGAQAPAATTTAPASMRPAFVSTPRTRLSRRRIFVHRGPLEYPGTELVSPSPEAFDRGGGVGVAALGLPGCGAQVLDVGERLEVAELARREGDGVDPDRAQHLDVLPERVGIRRGDDVHEPRVGEYGRAAHDLRPVLEDGEAGEREPRVPLVGVVHPHERARPARGAAGQRRLLAENDARDAPRGQGIRDARAVDAATDHHDVGGLSHPEGYSFRRIPYHVASPARRFTFGLGRCLRP